MGAQTLEKGGANITTPQGAYRSSTGESSLSKPNTTGQEWSPKPIQHKSDAKEVWPTTVLLVPPILLAKTPVVRIRSTSALGVLLDSTFNRTWVRPMVVSGHSERLREEQVRAPSEGGKGCGRLVFNFSRSAAARFLSSIRGSLVMTC